jgi:hypothetical protein
MHPKLYMHEHFHLINNPPKYKCEIFQVFIHPFQNYGECKMQLMSSGFNNIQSEFSTAKERCSSLT